MTNFSMEETPPRCKGCGCEFQAMPCYAGNVLCCPHCGALWLNRSGLQAVVRQMQHHRVDPEQMCREFALSDPRKSPS